MKNLGVIEAKKLIDSNKISSKELVEYYLSRIEQLNPKLNAYITVNKDAVNQTASDGKLSGVPIAVKDVFSTKGLRTTCASNMLSDYTPVFESTATKKLLEQGAVIIGKTNLDEFCHGSSTETSYFGPSRNPHDIERLPGGSSGGSAVATVADLASGSLGTETAGSLRQPASWCGCVGLKPTYGRVSRYGVLAMGSSLDSPGPLTKSVEDAAYLLGIMAGQDPNDFTSSERKVENYYGSLNSERIKRAKLAIPKEWMEMELDTGVRKTFEATISELEKSGTKIDYVQLLDPELSIAVYTIVCRSEVSSNLSRYNGVRYGLTVDEANNSSDYMERVRGEGFGDEPKRRIMTGKFSLSAGYSDKYYAQAELVRQMITDDLNKILKNYDAIIGPTTPVPAMPLGETSKNPLFGEMMDVLMEASSLSGMPGISVPIGYSGNLPTGLQIFSRHWEEQLILDLALGVEKLVEYKSTPAVS